jgi:hypothetical protein
MSRMSKQEALEIIKQAAREHAQRLADNPDASREQRDAEKEIRLALDRLANTWSEDAA